MISWKFVVVVVFGEIVCLYRGSFFVFVLGWVEMRSPGRGGGELFIEMFKIYVW